MDTPIWKRIKYHQLKREGRIITTPRLKMRPIFKYDANDIFQFCHSPIVGRNGGWKPHENIIETRTIIEKYYKPNYFHLGITVKPYDKVIGSISITEDFIQPDKHDWMLGYSLNEEFWNNGYASEAVPRFMQFCFEQLRLPRYAAYCFPENIASQHILEKNGFIFQGELIDSFKEYDGEIRNLFYYMLSINI